MSHGPLPGGRPRPLGSSVTRTEPTTHGHARVTAAGSRRTPWRYVVLALVVVAALALRWVFVDVQSGDYRAFLSPWFRHLDSSGFAGLADEFSNYNTPYLVLLWLATALPVSQIVAIKSISVIFDLLLAFFAYKIVRQVRPAATWLPVIITGLVLFLPTVVLNSSAWGQCDAIYGSLCLGSVYALLRRRAWLACALFGLAFAFKLQAIFLLPVLVAVLIINRMQVRALVMVPITFLAALVPAWVAGRGLVSQLAVYPAQISGSSGAAGHGSLGDPARSGGGRPPGGRRWGGDGGAGVSSGGPPPGGGGPGGGGGDDLGNGSGIFGLGGGTWSSDTSHVYTYNAATWYAWLPADASRLVTYAGLGLTVAVIAGLGIWLLRRGRALLGSDVVVLAAAATLTIAFLLPEMHERYFYVGEVLAVIAIAVDRWFVGVAAAIQVASISTYWGYLTSTAILPLEVSAVFAALAAAGSLVILVRRLRRPGPSVPT